MQKLLEKNSLLEKSLSDAKTELEGLKAKSTDLEEFYRLLNDEKYNLLNEISDLVSQLESVEAKLSNLEKMFTKLEEKYADAEETTDNKALVGCGFSGPIPDSIGSLKQLTVLRFDRNKLSGGLPLNFKNLEKLSELDLSNNSFNSYDIPSWVSSLPELTIAYVIPSRYLLPVPISLLYSPCYL
ncbi:hypothetical protein RJT34_17248 [Clitoria ternatea]|uniref:Uncharacterized protein n=1 Tax=Clitoria ternatea TaxID=43366 RepID=A0AAN9J9V9_CLITE